VGALINVMTTQTGEPEMTDVPHVMRPAAPSAAPKKAAKKKVATTKKATKKKTVKKKASSRMKIRGGS
jgi:hypothetical protein